MIQDRPGKMHQHRQHHGHPTEPAQGTDGPPGLPDAGNGKQHGRADHHGKQQAGINFHARQHRRRAKGRQPGNRPVIPAEEQTENPRRKQRRHGAVAPGGKDGQPEGGEQVGHHGPGQGRKPAALQQIANGHAGGQNDGSNHHQQPRILPAEDLHHAVLQRGQQREIVGVAHVGIHVDGKASVRVQLPDDAHPVGIGIMILNAHAVQRPETGGAEQQPDQQRGPKHPLTELPPVHQKQQDPRCQRGQSACHKEPRRCLPQRKHDYADIGRQQHAAYGAQQRLPQLQRAYQRHPEQCPAQQRGKIPSVCHWFSIPSENSGS